MRTDLLVIGAGPYAYSAAAYAQDRGIDTTVVGIPMAFWRDRMPADMFLRSGTDWHLDPSGVHTFAAFVEERGLDPSQNDPIPISMFLDHTDWFAAQKGLEIDQRLVSDLARSGDGFVATMADGEQVTAERVLAAPGVGYFVNYPDWADRVPESHRAHTADQVTFDELAGARVAIIGGRQSAYEWAALLSDHGAERVDVVHRHRSPAFEKVSWAFVDEYVDQTLAHRGWWRGLQADQQSLVATRFWEVGRLTLEHWLVPRLKPGVVHVHPETSVTDVSGDGPMTLVLSDGETMEVDRVVFASGYKCDMRRVPYLAGVIDDVSVTDGFPDLSEGFETSLPGLYVVGFPATRDFGPFYGFTKGCPSAGKIVVDEMLRAN